MKKLNKVTKFLNNGQAEMREFLERIRQETEKPEERLVSLSFIDDEIKVEKQELRDKQEKFIQYDFTEFTM